MRGAIGWVVLDCCPDLHVLNDSDPIVLAGCAVLAQSQIQIVWEGFLAYFG